MNHADTTYDASAFDIPCLLLSVDKRRQAHTRRRRWNLKDWAQEQAGRWQRKRRATGPLSTPSYSHVDLWYFREFPRVERIRSGLKLITSPLRLQKLFNVDSQKLDLVTEYEFEAGADAPMSMAYGENVRVPIRWPSHPYVDSYFTYLHDTVLPITVPLHRLWCKWGTREDRERYKCSL